MDKRKTAIFFFKKKQTNKSSKERGREEMTKLASKQLPWTREKPKKIKTPNKQTE
jgi:hypothetical protein